MTEKRFTITQKKDYFYVRDEVNKKPMGMFEFKQDEFPVYFCFHKIIDLLNEQHETIQVLERYLDNMRCGALTDDKRIKELYDENKQLKEQIKKLEAQLHSPYDSICINCINEFLVQKDKYYISKCKKGHEQCSKADVKYCDDFELKK